MPMYPGVGKGGQENERDTSIIGGNKVLEFCRFLQREQEPRTAPLFILLALSLFLPSKTHLHLSSSLSLSLFLLSVEVKRRSRRMMMEKERKTETGMRIERRTNVSTNSSSLSPFLPLFPFLLCQVRNDS